jgi:hypothetical protein
VEESGYTCTVPPFAWRAEEIYQKNQDTPEYKQYLLIYSQTLAVRFILENFSVR